MNFALFKVFSMRIKLGTTSNKEWRCCFCLHVRTATMAFGIYHLLLHVLALSVLAFVMRKNHTVNSAIAPTPTQRYNNYFDTDFLPTPLSKVKDDDNPYYLPSAQDQKFTEDFTDVDIETVMTFCTLCVTLLMVYGVMKGVRKHILPFFFFQLLDFAFTALTMGGYFCYFRSTHRVLAEQWQHLPFRQELLSLSPQNLYLLVLTSLLLTIMWKAYWIGVVWRCCKYLTVKDQLSMNTVHYIMPAEGSDRTDPDYTAMFRDAESAALGPLKQTPPPSYQDVMDEQPPPYPAATSTTTIVQELPVRRFLFTYAAQEPPQPENVSEPESAAPQPETPVESPVASTSAPTTVTSPNKPQQKTDEETHLRAEDIDDTEYEYVEILAQPEMKTEQPAPNNVNAIIKVSD
uniref:Lysosomal-associated transmembrane protein 4A n=2 Tax=Dendroctonus ponderosae TaxID=77166 RepID=A0AAR5QAE2_DENPD